MPELTAYGAMLLLVYAAAVVRVTRLLNFDMVLDRWRAGVVWLFRGHPTAVYFVTCPWCVSLWVGLATAWLPTVHLGLPWWFQLLLALAVSLVTGLLAPLTNDPDLTAEDDDELEPEPETVVTPVFDD